MKLKNRSKFSHLQLTTILLLLSTAIELRAQTEAVPLPRRGRGGATAVPIDPNAKPVLTGRIVDDHGDPVTDAQIMLRGTTILEGRRLQSLAGRTDANGRYSISGLEQADEFRVQIQSQRCVGIADYTKSPLIRLEADTTATRDFTLQRACQIRVQVINELLEPVPKARLLLGSLAEERYRSSPRAVLTDTEGFATLGGAASSDAEYVIGVMADDYAFGRLVTKLNNADAVATGMIMLNKGEDVTGTAICSDGKPAAGWRVVALPDWWHFGTSPGGAEIDADGVFTLRHISAADSYTVSISIPTGQGSSTRKQVLAATKLLPRNAPLAIKLEEVSPQSMKAIAGTVRLTGSAPKSSIGVYANPLDHQPNGSSFTSVRDGKFRIESLAPGRYSLQFQSAEIEEKTIPNVTAGTENLEVELVVRGKDVLRGVAVNAETGEPLKQFRVRVAKLQTLRGTNYGQDENWHTINDAKGEFELELNGPGIYQALIAADGLAWTRSQPVNTDENKGAPIKITLTAGASLTGTVVDEQGQPVDGAKVIPVSRAAGATSREYAGFASDDGAVQTVAGRFTLKHLEPGKEKLKVTHPDFCFTLVEDVELPAAGAEVKPITLHAGGTIRGRVYNELGQPERNVTLFVDNGQGSSYPGDNRNRLATATTNASGDYEIRHLPNQLCYVVRQNEWESQGVVRNTIMPENGQTRTLDFGGETPVAGKMLVNGVPLANTKLQLGGQNENFGDYKAFTKTDNAGNFIFWSPPVGKRILYYALSEQRVQWSRVRDIQVTGEPVDLGEIAHSTAKLLIRCEPQPDPSAFELELYLRRYESDSLSDSLISPTLSRGNPPPPYVFAAVAPGQYELSVSVFPHTTEALRPSVVGVRQRVEIVPGKNEQELSIRLPQGTASVRGRMEQDATRDSVRPTVIMSKDRRIVSWFAIQPDNSFELVGLPSGDYFVSDSDNPESDPMLEFSLSDGEQKTIEVTPEMLRRATPDYAMLMIHTYSSAGLPLPGCEITWNDGNNAPRQRASQDAYSSFTGAPGEYDMTVSYPGFEPVHRKVTLSRISDKPSRDTYDLNLILQPSAR